MGKKNPIRDAILSEKEIEIVPLRETIVDLLDIDEDDVLEIDDVAGD
jgi:hypothetical protein